MTARLNVKDFTAEEILRMVDEGELLPEEVQAGLKRFEDMLLQFKKSSEIEFYRVKVSSEWSAEDIRMLINFCKRHGLTGESPFSEILKTAQREALKGKIKRVKNLQSQPSVTDDQISNVLELYPTRQEQADKLGIDVRTLYRRLKKMDLE